jgi:hypothetical protein
MRMLLRQLSLGYGRPDSRLRAATAILAVAMLIGAGCAVRGAAVLDGQGDRAASAAATDGWFVAPPAPVAKAPVARQVPHGRGVFGKVVVAFPALAAASASARTAAPVHSASPAPATLTTGPRSIRGPPRV